MKIKIYQLLLVCTCLCPGLRAQLPVPKQVSLAKLVCLLESEAEGKTYNDGKNDYTLSFPEESFGFDFQSGRAWKAVYKTSGSDTYLAITENIDLAKVTGFTWDGSATRRVLMHFPKGTLRTAVSKNGGAVYMIDEHYLEFFCTQDLKLLLPLAEACHRLMVRDKKIAAADVQSFETRFSALMELPISDTERLLAEYAAFLRDHGKSLFVPIIREYSDNVKAVVQYGKESQRVKEFRDSLIAAFRYKPDVYSAAAYEAYNPQTKKLFRNKNYTTPKKGDHGSWMSDNDKFTTPGPLYANFRKNGLIYWYLLRHSDTGADLYADRLSWLESKIPGSFIRHHDPWKRIHINHQKTETCIVFCVSFYDGRIHETIDFQPTEYETYFHQ